MSALVDRAAAAYPDLTMDGPSFVGYVACRLPRESTLPDALAEVRAEDLFLASRCASVDPKALAAFDAMYVPDVRRIVSRFSGAGDPDDFRQELWKKLFVADESSKPRILEYSGRGDLRNWIRVLAVRAGIDAHRVEPPSSEPIEERARDLATPALGPDAELLKQTSTSAFRAAFEEASGELSPADRNLLRFHYVDDLSIDQIGALYGIHRATAARRIAKARSKLATRLRRALRRRTTAGETDSLVRLVGSRPELSLRRILR